MKTQIHRGKTMMIPTSQPHPLRERLKNAGITLWQLQQMLKGTSLDARASISQSRLSFYLTGKKHIPDNLKSRIEAVLVEVGA
jgi:hypothetical protein